MRACVSANQGTGDNIEELHHFCNNMCISATAEAGFHVRYCCTEKHWVRCQFLRAGNKNIQLAFAGIGYN